MNKVLVPVFAVLAVGASVFGIVEMNAAADQQALVDQLKAKLEQAEKDRAQADKDRLAALAQLADLKDNAARLARERDEAKARAKEIAAAAPADPGRPAAPAPPAEAEAKGKEVRGLLAGFAKRLDDPEVRKAMKDGQQRMIAGAYGALFKKLGLDEATTQLATELISDRNMAALDKGRKLMDGSASGEEAMASVRKDVEAVKADYDGKLRAVLGEQGFNELTGHEQTVGDQRALDNISRNFEKKGTPLAQEQRDSLSNIMREERMKYPSNDIPDLGGGPGMAMLMSDEEARVGRSRKKRSTTAS